MSVIKVKSGKRGRPIIADTDALYQQIEDLIPKAKMNLKSLRSASKGMRGEKLFGSSTSLPEWVEESIDLLDAQSLGNKLDYSDVKQIKQTIKSLKELSSKQARVFERGISEQLSKEYLQSLDKFADNSSSFVKQQIRTLKKQFLQKSAREKQQFLTSKGYQDPRSKGRYKRVKSWSTADSGKKAMSYQEAWAYLYRKRAENQLSVDWIEKEGLL